MLWANPQRGMRFDPVSGELVWWQNRTRRNAGDEGRVAPEHISRIRIVSTSDTTALHVYDLAGQRLPYLDEEVISGLPQAWANRMVERWPHIELEET